MKFTINDVVFCGNCGNCAAISQGKDVRLLNVYCDVWKDLYKKQHVIVNIECKLDADGTVWIVGLAEDPSHV